MTAAVTRRRSPRQIESERARNRRTHAVRSATIQPRAIGQLIEIGRRLFPGTIADHERPITRADCEARDRSEPCPMVSCRHHLYLEVSARTGSIQIRFPDREPWEMGGESCALELAERPVEIDAVAERLNLTREMARKVELVALAKVERGARSFASVCLCGGAWGEHRARIPHAMPETGCATFRPRAVRRRHLPVVR